MRLTNGKKRRSNDKKSSRGDPVTASVQKKLSEVTNVEKPLAHDVHKAKKKAAGRKRKKSRYTLYAKACFVYMFLSIFEVSQGHRRPMYNCQY